jgi:hypothetical protein
MKVLYINVGMHVKNHNALMSYKNILFFVINHPNLNNINLNEFDCVYSPNMPIDVSLYPNTKFIFGPHFSVFPDLHQMNIINKSNSIYIQPSKWASEVWENHSYCKNIKIKSLPFGVETNKFNEIKPFIDRTKVFIYCKRRDPNELNLIKQFLNDRNIEYKIFDYLQKYNENEYINYLQNSKYGIWLDAHESQGFALQEALSCNVPLFVWNIKSMKQEYGSSYNDIPATTIPYWDERCGEFFYNSNEIKDKFNLFLSKLETYKPRIYILENLSMEVCEKKLIELIENI